MQQKLQTRAFERVASLLHPGEQPIAAARAMVGAFTASRAGTIAHHGVVLAGAGAGSAALAAHRKQFVVVTNYRVFFLPQTILGGPGKTVLAELPRTQVALAEAKIGFASILRLAFSGTDGVSLTFPRSDQKNAVALAESLR
ncbi:hypothetical protein FB565_008313 [Actinoplanes lutulentus]|uniref:PH (Pleckstrin Homology) domain-containing protein n=1 Tax=Actinoplanes lutulentus TaxID=1287878 RepID=A0A327Z7U3_9ACTN|nr:hypothetical protein [Actinoplanes lutulentus]MBB2948530.1 hypothetical protein [Actinoplanes lutulentus]RAK34438.1 hypothetical protein B0I29_11137 [Actinoplanes lutulentus]